MSPQWARRQVPTSSQEWGPVAAGLGGRGWGTGGRQGSWALPVKQERVPLVRLGGARRVQGGTASTLTGCVSRAPTPTLPLSPRPCTLGAPVGRKRGPSFQSTKPTG